MEKSRVGRLLGFVHNFSSFNSNTSSAGKVIVFINVLKNTFILQNKYFFNQKYNRSWLEQFVCLLSDCIMVKFVPKSYKVKVTRKIKNFTICFYLKQQVKMHPLPTYTSVLTRIKRLPGSQF